MARRSSGPSGVVLVDKPEGPTSHDVVAAVRRALGQRRVGHAGTLDPFATGVLACLLGPATRLARYLSACDKTYRGVVRFGVATDTGDRTGRPLAPPVEVPALGRERIVEAAGGLTGPLDQVPPMYSAKKRSGTPLHELARRGIEVERAPARIAVRRWSFDEPGGDRVGFEVECSAGTYVRVLAEDLGRALGLPAHLEELRRLRAGPFAIAECVPLDHVDASAVVPVDHLPLPLPVLRLGDAEAAAIRHGRRLTAPAVGVEGDAVALRDPAGRLLGVGRVLAGGALAPEVVLPE